MQRTGSPAGGAAIPVAGWARRFDRWAGSYDASQLQTVLYGPSHAAVLRRPGRILDAGCGTGLLAARLTAAFNGARVAGVDLSAGMIKSAAAAQAGPDAGSWRAARRNSRSPARSSAWWW